jgi:glycosyltransferase involved in cell wall biosynthesis
MSMPPFSILLPTWNNLPFLRLCVESLRRHSSREHQLLVHANDGSDGTRQWLREQGIEHTASDANIGICHAVNLAGEKARGDYVLYLNDDMVVAPGWDTALEHALERVKHHDLFMLSGTMIEPGASGNACVVVSDFGRDPARFDLERFAREAPGLARADWLGATWPGRGGTADESPGPRGSRHRHARRGRLGALGAGSCHVRSTRQGVAPAPGAGERGHGRIPGPVAERRRCSADRRRVAPAILPHVSQRSRKDRRSHARGPRRRAS